MATKYSDKLKNKRVLITGGTSGLGFCSAEACVELGATVVIASSKQQKIEIALTRLSETYPLAKGRIQGHPVDFAASDIEAGIRSLLDFATDNGQHLLDHVVDTTGDTLALVPLEDTTQVTLIQASQVRLIAPIILAKLLPKYMTPSHESSFTLTSGANCTKPAAGWTIPITVGAAKEGLTRALAKDLHPIRVNCVAPGVVKTEMFEGIAANHNIPVEAVLAPFKEQNITKTIGSPEDLAESYLYFMKNSYVTGTTAIADGGYTLL